MRTFSRTQRLRWCSGESYIIIEFLQCERIVQLKQDSVPICSEIFKNKVEADRWRNFADAIYNVGIQFGWLVRLYRLFSAVLFRFRHQLKMLLLGKEIFIDLGGNVTSRFHTSFQLVLVMKISLEAWWIDATVQESGTHLFSVNLCENDTDTSILLEFTLTSCSIT